MKSHYTHTHTFSTFIWKKPMLKYTVVSKVARRQGSRNTTTDYVKNPFSRIIFKWNQFAKRQHAFHGRLPLTPTCQRRWKTSPGFCVCVCCSLTKGDTAFISTVAFCRRKNEKLLLKCQFCVSHFTAFPFFFCCGFDTHFDNRKCYPVLTLLHYISHCRLMEFHCNWLRALCANNATFCVLLFPTQHI